METKAILRRRLRAIRRRLVDRDARSDRILRRVAAHPAVMSSRTVAWYVAQATEVATRAGIEKSWARGQRVLLPSCDGEALRFVAIDQWRQLAVGRFGILEPRREQATRDDVPLATADVVIVPGVAFDRRGARLGQGGGFYDRALADLPPSVLIVGLAFDCQLIPEIPTGPHDQWLHAVATESEWIPGQRADGENASP